MKGLHREFGPLCLSAFCHVKTLHSSPPEDMVFKVPSSKQRPVQTRLRQNLYLEREVVGL
jgi:hypothetical protein